MLDLEYERADRELFAMVNGRRPTGGKTVGVVVPVARARELEGLEKILNRIHKAVPAAKSAAAAGVFFAATVLGWMDPRFGFVVTSAAAVRAVWLFWRMRHGSEQKA